MKAGFSPAMYQTFAYLENNWEQLVQEIRQGRVSRDLNIEAGIRDELNMVCQNTSYHVFKIAQP